MTEQLAGGWTLAKLQARSSEDRFNIWENARRQGTEAALTLAKFIEDSGLDYAPKGGISMSDPRVIEMNDIITSKDGRKACVAAADSGRPALAGVEPLIKNQMGSRYNSGSQITVTAGSLVGMLMYSLGYAKGPPRPMPEGSIAKSAATWLPKHK